MTIQLQEVTKIEKEVVSITCNRCERTVTPYDTIEWQEFFSYVSIGGYGSVFGDGQSYRIDLCQHCLQELLESFVEYT
jgi:hypothetical protein